jgi:hypothetical protein
MGAEVVAVPGSIQATMVVALLQLSSLDTMIAMMVVTTTGLTMDAIVFVIRESTALHHVMLMPVVQLWI